MTKNCVQNMQRIAGKSSLIHWRNMRKKYWRYIKAFEITRESVEIKWQKEHYMELLL